MISQIMTLAMWDKWETWRLYDLSLMKAFVLLFLFRRYLVAPICIQIHRNRYVFSCRWMMTLYILHVNLTFWCTALINLVSFRSSRLKDIISSCSIPEIPKLSAPSTQKRPNSWREVNCCRKFEWFRPFHSVYMGSIRYVVVTMNLFCYLITVSVTAL